jgi:signal transduction histidine kinase
VVLVVASPLALLFLRRTTVGVLWFVVAATLAYLVRGYPYGPVMISVVVAVFAAVLAGHRAAAWSAVGLLYVGHLALGGGVRGDARSWGEALGVGAWALLILVSSEFARVRRDRAGAARAARMESQRRQANEERLRIARELHDTVAHHMSLINVQAGVALHLIERRPEQAEKALTAIRAASQEGLAELRALVDVIRDDSRPAPRAPTEMLASLPALAEQSRAAGLVVTTRVRGDERPLPTAVELAAFRIIQEAITNVIRHSGAAAAEIGLDYGDRELTVQIDDGGRGGVPTSDTTGSGIRGMRERADSLHGSLTVAPSPMGGLRIQAVLPTGGEP